MNEGETARLECKVAGSPLPEVKFRKLGHDDRFEEGTAPGDDRIQLTQREEDGYQVSGEVNVIGGGGQLGCENW